MNNYKINPNIFQMFGGKVKKKKAKQKRKKKSKKKSTISLKNTDNGTQDTPNKTEETDTNNTESNSPSHPNPIPAHPTIAFNDSVNSVNSFHSSHIRDNKSRLSEADDDDDDDYRYGLSLDYSAAVSVSPTHSNCSEHSIFTPINTADTPVIHSPLHTQTPNVFSFTNAEIEQKSDMITVATDNDSLSENAQKFFFTNASSNNICEFEIDNSDLCIKASPIQSVSKKCKTSQYCQYTNAYNIGLSLDTTPIRPIMPPTFEKSVESEIENSEISISVPKNCEFNLFGNDNENSFSLSYSDMANETPRNKFNNFNLNNIGQIGAIKTDDFIKHKFNENRRKSIQNDLNDLMLTDEEMSQSCHNKVSIVTVLKLFQLNSVHISNYFGKELCIKCMDEMIDYLPNRIRIEIVYKHKCVRGIKMLKQWYRLLRYVSNGVLNNEWNGSKQKEWIDLNTNVIYRIFQEHSGMLVGYERLKELRLLQKNCDKLKYRHHKRIHLNGFERKYVTIKTSHIFVEIKVMVRRLPERYRFEPGLINIGIESDKKDMICICDRLIVRGNENTYLCSMFDGNFIENDSCVYIRLWKRPKKRYLNVNICCDKNREISKNFKLKTNKYCKTANVFIEQFKGFGEYAVLY